MERCVLKIAGMTCAMCRQKVQRALEGVSGVKTVSVSYEKGTAEVRYDAGETTIAQLQRAVRAAGYDIEARSRIPKGARAAGYAFLILALYLLLEYTGVLNRLVPGELAQTGMSYGALFVIGLTTSVHCVAMCGGIGLSQSLSGQGGSAFRRTIAYQAGRVLSYTGVGFMLGLIGMLLGTGLQIGLSAQMQGIFKLAVGAMMLLTGLNLLGVFPALRRLQLRIPVLRKRGSAPFVVGLLNGLMPCGPLQSMQLLALASANPVRGALSMLCFCLGTVPLMLGVGSAMAALGRRFHQTITAVGAVLVAVMALAMMTQGAALTGILPDAQTVTETNVAQTEADMQIVRSTLLPNRYSSITVEAGKPVRWIIDAPEGSINGCNNRMYIPDLQLEYTFHTGENIIEFTPEKSITYSCWMGMIRGNIEVVEPN